MRVEAASYFGRPLSFFWIGPWTKPPDPWAPADTDVGLLVFEIVLLLCLIGGAVVARRNVLAGRGDRRGAVRLGAAIFFAQAAMWVLGGHHVKNSYEGWLFILGFNNAVAMGVGFWLLYLAVEPFARRRWPAMLVSWTRALSGRWRDPLVGRDILIGASVGCGVGLILGPGRVLLPMALGIPGPPPHRFDYAAPVSPGSTVAWLLSYGVLSAFWVLGIVFLVILVRGVTRRGWLAGLVVTMIFAATFIGSPGPAVTLPLAALSIGILIAVTIRFGVLAGIVSETCRRVAGYLIYSSDPSSWTFYAGMIAVAGILVLAWWAAKKALAGRPLFAAASEGGG